MKVLIVGAGAVGVVYGHHLQLGGAEVSFFVRARYADECRRGFTMYRLRRRRQRVPERFDDPSVLTLLTEVTAQAWDQIWLAIPTTALRGDWLAPFVEASGDATIVSLQPGLWSRRRVEQHVPPDRLVSGYIGIVSYQAPLDGEVVPKPGVAYWFPPFSASRFSGPAEAVNDAVRTLRRGGCPARSCPDAVRLTALSTVHLMPQIVALQGAGWSFRELRRSPLLALAVEAGREGIAAASAEMSVRAPLVKRMLGPRAFKLGWLIAPKAAPFDMETYLKVHFTKLVEQTQFGMQQLIELAAKNGLPADQMRRLTEEVFGGVPNLLSRNTS